MGVMRKAEKLFIVRAIREGLIDMIPVLLIGAFALVLKTFPVEAYQDIIKDSVFVDFLSLIYSATFGVLSVYMALFISRAYVNLKTDSEVPMTGAVASSLLAFFIFAGGNLTSDNLGPKSMFIAIIAGLGATALYIAAFKKIRNSHKLILSQGADKSFDMSLMAFHAVMIVALAFALIDIFATHLFGVASIRELTILAFSKLFISGKASFFNGLLFVFLSSVLWFFGIHGSDTLEGVMQNLFTQGLAANQRALSMGVEPTSILNKPFFDCFVLMGGCGATICLLIAILAFSKNRGRRELGYSATFPMIFNINELMVFGLPVIYNPVMLIPFLITPIVCYCIAYFSMAIGLVPLVTSSVEWTTPIIFGGYYATGSIAGSVLQIINVVVGVFIYMPFVWMLDRQSEDENAKIFDDFMNYFIAHETTLCATLKDRRDSFGAFARSLAAELRHDIDDGVKMYYQPQFNYEGECVGVESLLRWEHPVYGILYPPLVMRLAEEGGFLPEIEETVVKKVLNDAPRVREKFGNVKISLNITGTTIVTERFLKFCSNLKFDNICIEITEQAAVTFDEGTIDALKTLHSMGVILAIDDFSMGHTSINYLKNNLFDIIKLDGSLVKGLPDNENCREIINSITRLADSLGMIVVAEFVETEEQKEVLHEIGCDCYQGWLYSPAVSLED